MYCNAHRQIYNKHWMKHHNEKEINYWYYFIENVYPVLDC